MRKRDWTSWIRIILFVVILIVGVILFVKTEKNCNQITSLKKQFDVIISEGQAGIQPSQLEVEYYRELSNKTDNSITQIYTVLGLCLTVFAIAGGVVAFKAPLDIESQITNLKDEINKAEKLSKETTYQSRMIEVQSKKTSFEKIHEWGKIIDEFPEKAQPYLNRGYEKLNLKEIDSAISDFRIAKKMGVSDADFYTAMGRTLNKQREYQDALGYLDRAANEKPVSAMVLDSMAFSYKGLRQYEKSLECLQKVLNNDSSNYLALYNRSMVYREMIGYENDQLKKIEYEKLRVKDLLDAEKINPEDIAIQRAIMLDMRYTGTDSKGEYMRIRTYAQLCLENATEYTRFGDIENAIKQYERASWTWGILNEKGSESEVAKEKLDVIATAGIAICKEHSTYIETIRDNNNLTRTISIYAINEGVDAYKKKEFEKAEHFFESAITVENKNYVGRAFVNLAFMKRRNETEGIADDAKKLLEKCVDTEKRSAFWTFNRALIELDMSGEESAVQIIKQTQTDVDEALEWWSNTELLGDEEIGKIISLLQKTTIDYNKEKFNISQKE